MIDAILVPETRGLRKAELFNLGKINVVCGKNNSGKSTLFHGILSINLDKPHKNFFGKLITKDEFDDAFETSNRIKGQEIDSDFVNTLRNTIQGKIWFPIDRIYSDVFVKEHPEYRNYEQLLNNLGRYIDSIVISPKEITLLPLSRGVQDLAIIPVDFKVHPSGDGILADLYRLKNQVAESPEMKSFIEFQAAFERVTKGIHVDLALKPAENNKPSLRWMFSHDLKNWWGIQESGRGLIDLIIILYFAMFSRSDLLLIEEPENHIHPEIQRDLLSFLRYETNKQYFFTTHSNIFLDSALVDKVFYTYYDGEVHVEDMTSKAIVLNQLGYSVGDNLVSDLIILVEGPTDRQLLEELLIKFELYGKYAVKIWWLGGDAMVHADLSTFLENSKVISLIDNDPKSEARQIFIDNCSKYGIECVQLERYAIENYYPIDALRKVFGNEGMLGKTTFIEPDKKLEEQIGISSKRIKRNTKEIAQNMSLTDIEGTDLYKFLLRVKGMLEER